MPYLVQAAFCVGVIGTVAALPLLYLVPAQSWYLTDAAFRASSAVLLFLTAAATFAAIYLMLPSNHWRTRVAGVLAGILTFFGFAIWMRIMVNVRIGNHQSWPDFLYPFVVMFVFAGWIPVSVGWLAGWLVSKLADTPGEEVA